VGQRDRERRIEELGAMGASKRLIIDPWIPGRD
jgi:hypothetical protein